MPVQPHSELDDRACLAVVTGLGASSAIESFPDGEGARRVERFAEEAVAVGQVGWGVAVVEEDWDEFGVCEDGCTPVGLLEMG